MFSFETNVGTGKGMIRLVCLPNGAWMAHMIYTALQELHSAKEIAGYNRPHGGNNSLKGGAVEGNWYERRERKKEFLDEQPAVLIVGAGQSGLNLGARLQSLGLSVLIVEKTERVGDSWRHRYRTLVTHDPVQYTHMAFMRFPDNWPLFTPSKIDAYGPAKVHFQLTIIPQRTSSPTGSKCTPAPWSSTSGSNQRSGPPTSRTTRRHGPSM